LFNNFSGSVSNKSCKNDLFEAYILSNIRHEDTIRFLKPLICQNSEQAIISMFCYKNRFLSKYKISSTNEPNTLKHLSQVQFSHTECHLSATWQCNITLLTILSTLQQNRIRVNNREKTAQTLINFYNT